MVRKPKTSNEKVSNVSKKRQHSSLHTLKPQRLASYHRRRVVRAYHGLEHHLVLGEIILVLVDATPASIARRSVLLACCPVSIAVFFAMNGSFPIPIVVGICELTEITS